MTDSLWNRRTFLKKSTILAALFFCGQPAWGESGHSPSLPEGRLSLHNTHNNERLTLTYRDALGRYDQEALKALNWILRCHFTNEVAEMDLRVIEYLNRVDKNLGGGNEIQIISGYRSPSYNGLLRHEGSGVAKNSYHMKGKAIDIAIPGIAIHAVRQVALSLEAGGVGYYPQTGFVHIDSGKVRSWSRG